MILVQILNCHQLTRDIAGANFNFIPCLELEVYAQKTNLCFSRTWKKITNFRFLKSELDECIKTFFLNDALLLN